MQAFGIFDERHPTETVYGVVKRDFDQGFATAAVKTGGDDLGVVENQDVSRAENVGEVVKMTVGYDAFFRQVKQA